MKGIILAGGNGTRLYPMTLSISKHLLPVYDKPMIYYPLSTLMLAGIKDICIVTTEHDSQLFKKLLGDGNRWGINLNYFVQKDPKGIADVYNVVSDYVENHKTCLILGDNIFYSEGLTAILENAKKNLNGAKIFGYPVKDPERYGVLNMDSEGKVVGIEEKPKNPTSKYVVPGLYFYDETVTDIIKTLKPSKRGELEITDVNKFFLERNQLEVDFLGRGTAWYDTGTPESLIQCGQFIQAIENRQGLKIGCLEEIALYKDYINLNQFSILVSQMPDNDYKKYLMNLLEERG